MLAWNILHGGGPRRGPEILLELLSCNADVIVLTEFRRAFGGQIAGVLAEHGWRWQEHTSPPAGVNGVLVASRLGCERAMIERAGGSPAVADAGPGERDWRRAAWRYRLLDVSIPGLGLVLTAAHVPDARRFDGERLGEKASAWGAVLRACERWRGDRHLLIGDLNTGRHRLDEPGSTYTCGALLGRLSVLGHRDAFRLCEPDRRESTWFSRTGAGFRHDQAWVSAALAGDVVGVEHRWCGPTESGGRCSDHAAIVVELSRSWANGGGLGGRGAKTPVISGDCGDAGTSGAPGRAGCPC